MKIRTMRVELSTNEYANFVCSLDDSIEKCAEKMSELIQKKDSVSHNFYCYWCGRLVDLTYTRGHLLNDWDINC